MKKIIGPVLGAAIFLQLSVAPAQALVKFGQESKDEIKGIKLSQDIKMDDAAPAIKRVTQGLRQKKVVFAWFSVYVAQIFSSGGKPEFDSSAKLKESLSKGFPVVVSMTFVRDVDIGKISDGFLEGFKENGMDASKAPYLDFITAIKASGDVKDRQNYFFVFSQSSGKESLSVQTKMKEIFSLKDQVPGTIATFLNIWLGKPTDSGLEQLQDQLLKNTL